MDTKAYFGKDPVLYFKHIQQALSSLSVSCGSGKNPLLTGEDIWRDIARIFKLSRENNGKIIFIGNGGSAAIAGHMALDFSNRGKLRAICFNDGPMLTCLANDYSYERVFQEAIEIYADSGDILVAISSSGQSKNILNGVVAAKQKTCSVITLSGFDIWNPLRTMGDLNIYIPIPRPNYGLVEVSHHIVLHFILDYILENPA